MMRGDFTPYSAASVHWKSTVLLNYRFAATIFTFMFTLACVGQFLLLIFAPKTQPGGIVFYTLPVVIGLLVFFEWSEVRSLKKHGASIVTRNEDYPAASIWLAAVLESIAPLAGFYLIGGFIGWQTALGGPPLVAAVIIPLVSILRLDYRICIMQGVVGALGYWLIVGMALSHSDPGLLAEGPILQVGKGVLLIATGVLAGLIALQNRRRLHEVIYALERR